MEAHKVEPIATEFKIFSRKHMYAGTCDLDAVIDGERCIVDFKTSSGIYPEMLLQTAAYQFARAEELYGGELWGDQPNKYDARWIVRFDKKTGKFEAKRFDDFESDFQGFLGALQLYRRLKK